MEQKMLGAATSPWRWAESSHVQTLWRVRYQPPCGAFPRCCRPSCYLLRFCWCKSVDSTNTPIDCRASEDWLQIGWMGGPEESSNHWQAWSQNRPSWRKASRSQRLGNCQCWGTEYNTKCFQSLQVHGEAKASLSWVFPHLGYRSFFQRGPKGSINHLGRPHIWLIILYQVPGNLKLSKCNRLAMQCIIRDKNVWRISGFMNCEYFCQAQEISQGLHVI